MKRRSAMRLVAVATGLVAWLGASAAWADETPAPSAPSTLGTRPTSLAEAVAVALRQNPDALTSESQVREAEGARTESKGGFFPKLHLDANVQEWNGPFVPSSSVQSFTDPRPVHVAGQPFPHPAADRPLEHLRPVQDRGAMALTSRTSSAGRPVAKWRSRWRRPTTACSRPSAWPRWPTPRSPSSRPSRSEAQSLFDNGVIGKNDLLRAGLALATARQRAIQSRGEVTLARGQVDTVLGNPTDTPFEPVPFAGDPPAVQDPSVQSAESRAVAQRLELVVVDRSIAQADHGVAAARKKYVPQINAIANYTHLGGQPFQPTDAEYVGLFASWDVWDWGTTGGGVDQASEKLEQARIARKKVEDQVRLEAREAFVNADDRPSGPGRGEDGGRAGRGELPHRLEEVRGQRRRRRSTWSTPRRSSRRRAPRSSRGSTTTSSPAPPSNAQPVRRFPASSRLAQSSCGSSLGDSVKR